jgi:hypothetical protein
MIERADSPLDELVDGLIRLRGRLDEFGVPNEKFTHVVRTLHHARMLDGLRLVAVAGGQGAGKTTLVRTLYPEAEGWLAPNLGRGEKIPVCVVEVPEQATPRAVAVFRRGADIVERVFRPEEIEDWQRVLRGGEPDVLMARLEVSPSVWRSSFAGFVLLPGFERMDGYWQTLMRVVLSTSKAAVVVADEGRLADGMQERIVEDLRGTGADDAADVVVALSRCDGEDAETLRELTLQAGKVFGVPAEKVVPFGPDRDDPKGWMDRFVKTVGDILPAADERQRREAGHLRRVITVDVAALLAEARAAFDERVLADDGDVQQLNSFLRPFDEERDQLLDRLDALLEARFGMQGMQGRAWNVLAESIGRGAVADRAHRLLELMAFDPLGRDRRLIAEVRKAWPAQEAKQVQRTLLDELSDTRLRELTAQFALAHRGNGPAPTTTDLVLAARKPLGMAPPEPGEQRAVEPQDAMLLQTMALLPAMAVATRGFALSFTDEHGQFTVFPTGSDLEGRIKGLTDDRKALLAGTAIFLGLDVAVDGQLNSPQVIAKAVGALLTGGNGGAAAGAAAAAPYVALGIAAVAGGMALVAAANRATRERANLGRQLLQEHRNVTVANVREGVTGLLRVTREIVAARMAADLGIGIQQQQRYALLQAVHDVESARARLLRDRADRDLR